MAEIVFIKPARAVARLRRQAARQAAHAGTEPQIAVAASAVCAAVDALAEATAALNAAIADYFMEDGRPARIRLDGVPEVPTADELRTVCAAKAAFARIAPASLPAGGVS